MIFSLSSDLDHAEGAVGVAGSVSQHAQEVSLADMVGAGAGDQNAAGAQHLQGTQVEFFVAAEGGIEVALALGERWRVEDDGVVALAGGGVVLEQIEGVSFDPFDFRLALVAAVKSCVLVGNFECSPGTIYAGDVGTAREQMKRETSLVAEDVEGIAVSVLGSGGVVLALVEEGSGLLAFEGVELELDTVHGEDGRGFFALHQPRGAGRQILELADSRVDTLDDGCRMQSVGKFRSQRLAHDFCVDGLREDLHRKNVVVAIDDEAGKEIGFAEDDAVGVGVMDDPFTIGDGFGDALAKQCGEMGDRLVRNQPDRDL